ncbi:hypothetical protein KFK09_004757 [Dendrobium nobile]|uniref:Endonuclease/exonuclease/phosphatase domain-containing protein n=1 Tax=Dendrobium nobile TaxID=94219 RepID=A0A8T3BX89_DENNO|nr:hypothetical protein KFK09_004757 [Dendrobium nobile]
MLEKYSTVDVPMVVGGDFNCLISREDKRGGKRFSFSQGPKEMKSFLFINDFHVVGFIGPKFTSCNNKFGEARNQERLDRCFLNSIVINSSHHMVLRHLARAALNHCPILLNFLKFNPVIKKNIKFEDVLAYFLASFVVVRKEWNKVYHGSSSHILNIKFKKTLKSLFYLSRAKLKNLYQ